MSNLTSYELYEEQAETDICIDKKNEREFLNCFLPPLHLVITWSFAPSHAVFETSLIEQDS